MKIDVTAKDIRAGKRRDCFGCPVVLALRRSFPRRRICVGRLGIYVRDALYNTPRSVARFISQFDAGKRVQPFSFNLSV